MTNTINNQTSNAPLSKRALNCVIDLTILVLVRLALNAMAGLSWEVSTFSFWLVNGLLFIYYYAIFEAATGKTPGKMVTDTRAIQHNGQPLTTDKAVLRSFVRLIPFEFLSFLFGQREGWHDRISGTCVIQAVSRQAVSKTSLVSLSNSPAVPESTFDHFVNNGYRGGYKGGHNNFDIIPAGKLSNPNESIGEQSDYKKGDLYK